MNYGLQLAAFCEQVSAFIARKWAAFRIYILLPALLWRGRNMALLTSGMWVDASPDIPVTSVAWMYDALNHRLVRAGSPETTPFRRWKWLSATSDCGRDMSEFFSDLRIVRGAELPDAKVIELFVHQKGWVPGRVLRVVDRVSAEEMDVYLDGRPTAAASAATAAAELDYIR